MINLIYWNCINNTIGVSNRTWVGINGGLSAYQCWTAIGFPTYWTGKSWYWFFCVFHSYLVLGFFKKKFKHWHFFFLSIFKLLPSLNLSCVIFFQTYLYLLPFYWIFWNPKGPVQFVLGLLNFKKISFMISYFSKNKKKISLFYASESLPLGGPFEFSTSLSLLTSKISNPKGPHSGTFFYTFIQVWSW